MMVHDYLFRIRKAAMRYLLEYLHYNCTSKVDLASSNQFSSAISSVEDCSYLCRDLTLALFYAPSTDLY